MHHFFVPFGEFAS